MEAVFLGGFVWNREKQIEGAKWGKVKNALALGKPKQRLFGQSLATITRPVSGRADSGR